MARSLILDLPKSLRQKIDTALEMGQSLRAVAEIAGCSHTVIDDYKRNIFIPARETAAKLLASQPTASDITAQASSSVAIAEATGAVIAADPYLTRMRAREVARQRVLDAAEDREDFRAWSALDRNDLSAIELEARLTGRLDSHPPAAGTTTVILMPIGSMPAAPQPQQIEAQDVEFRELPAGGPEKQR